MKADPADKPDARARHEARTAPLAPPIDDELLRNYLADALPPADLARVEKALRDSADLRARLEDVRNNREDFHLHTLGAIWHRGRLTCPTREQLGSLLLDALDPELASYFKFHLEVIECPYCRANLTDLESLAKAASARSPSRTHRQQRILRSIEQLLDEEAQGGRPGA